jgi:hypothetical protein
LRVETVKAIGSNPSLGACDLGLLVSPSRNKLTAYPIVCYPRLVEQLGQRIRVRDVTLVPLREVVDAGQEVALGPIARLAGINEVVCKVDRISSPCNEVIRIATASFVSAVKAARLLNVPKNSANQIERFSVDSEKEILKIRNVAEDGSIRAESAYPVDPCSADEFDDKRMKLAQCVRHAREQIQPVVSDVLQSIEKLIRRAADVLQVCYGHVSNRRNDRSNQALPVHPVGTQRV